jgi:hypothetical protein
MGNMRTYNTIADMHEVAKAQWKSYLINAGYEDAGEFSDEVLWDTAAQIITTADETGIYGTEGKDGKYQCWFTMEMESWARDEIDGIEAEIEILEYEEEEV